MIEVYNCNECVICLEPLESVNIIIFPCGHKCAHVTCFANSISNTGKFICPMCRFVVIPPPPPVSIDLLGGMRIISLIINGNNIAQTGDIPLLLDSDELQPHRRRISIQCQAINNNSGKRCKKKTLEESGYCYSHRNYA